MRLPADSTYSPEQGLTILLLFVFSLTGGFKVGRRPQLTGDERRRLLRAVGLTQQLPQQYIEDGGSRVIEDHLPRQAADDDAVHARRFSAWFRVSDEKDNAMGREIDKKWND